MGVGPARPHKKSVKRRRSDVDEVESVEISVGSVAEYVLIKANVRVGCEEERRDHP